MYHDEDKALAALNRAIDLGITYLDTAYAYGDGESESRVGQAMAARRKEVWLATKIPDRTREGFLRRLEGSLKRLRVDHVDLVHIHSLARPMTWQRLRLPMGRLRVRSRRANRRWRASSDDQSHQWGSDGPGYPAARPGLRADGSECLAQRTL